MTVLVRRIGSKACESRTVRAAQSRQPVELARGYVRRLKSYGRFLLAQHRVAVLASS